MKNARELLREHGLAPKKSFGQNFLVDAEALHAIATACVPDGERGRAFVVELGAGLGALTAELLPRVAKLAAIERDRELVPVLTRELAGPIEAGSLVVVEGDAKTVDLRALVSGAPKDAPRVLSGNLPYQLTGPLLERAVEHAAVFDRAVFLVQKEVADRLAAEPGTKEYGALTVFVQAAFAVHKARLVKPGSFLPPPEVTSAVVVLESRRPPIAEETERFRALVKAAFGARRKTLRNAWSKLGDDVLAAAPTVGISLDARGETLSVEDFARLAHALG